MKKEKGRSLVLVFSVLSFLLVFSVLLPLGERAEAQGRPIELSFATHLPPRASPYAGAFLPWAQELEKRSNGRLKIKFYLSETLVAARDAYDAVKTGIADITWFPFALNRGRFPLMALMELPFLSPDTYTGAHALTDLYKKFPELRDEVKDVHLLGLWVTLPYEIHTVGKPVRVLEDIRGMKLATQPGAAEAVAAVGAVPVTTPVPQIYPNLEKGVADGAALAWGAFNAYKIYEVTKYHTNAHLGGVAYGQIMNIVKWQSLGKELQAVMKEVTEEMLPDSLCRAVTNEAVVGMKAARERGGEIYDLPKDEMKRWVATAEPIWEKWVKDMEGKGLPGRAMLDESLRLIEKYEDYGKNR